MGLWLKYDNNFLQDGLGSQALRQSVIFGLSKYFNCGYVNSELNTAHQHYASGFNTRDDLNKHNQRLSELFQFTAETPLKNFKNKLRVKDLTPTDLFKYLALYKFSKHETLLEIGFPFYVLNRFPNSMKFLPGVLRSKFELDNDLTRRCRLIVVHLRFGYGSLVKTNAQPRHLPIEYYFRVISKLIENGNIAKSDKIIFHTDAPQEKSVFKIVSEVTLEELSSQGVTDGNSEVFLEPANLDILKELLLGYDFEIKHGADWVETFLDMANASALIMARSAFSYLGALYNPNVIIWPNNHGHAKLRKWTSSERIGVDANDFSLALG